MLTLSKKLYKMFHFSNNMTEEINNIRGVDEHRK